MMKLSVQIATGYESLCGICRHGSLVIHNGVVFLKTKLHAPILKILIIRTNNLA